MKKSIFNPGFEFIFTLARLAILGLPPLVFAQTTHDLNISINNGDTTINGRNIKDLSPKERQRALKDISNISAIGPVGPQGTMANMGHSDVRVNRFQRNGKDSVRISMHVDRFGANGKDSANMRRGMSMPMRKWTDDRRADRDPAMEFDHRNSQIFNFVTTDNNGISTHVSYRVSEPTGGLTHMGNDPDNHAQHEKLDMTDLNIVPEFSAGKTVIMFTLPSKAVADVQFQDSKGNLIWSERAVNGSFTKSFPMGLNGIYYLRVEQKGQLAVKKIFKEQM